jgi:TusA-related sulfurtransferase
MDVAIYNSLMANIDNWIQQSADICEKFDHQLDLSASITETTAPHETVGNSIDTIIDLSSYGCPLHYIKARNALRQYHQGAIIEFVFASGDPAKQAASSLASDGHSVMSIEETGVTTQIRVRKLA